MFPYYLNTSTLTKNRISVLIFDLFTNDVQQYFVTQYTLHISE